MAVNTNKEAALTYRPSQVIEKPSKDSILRMVEIGERFDILTGTYFYTPDVFDICGELEPSAGGQLEISDVNKDYMVRNALTVAVADGWWTDAGTFTSLHNAKCNVRKSGANKDAL